MTTRAYSMARRWTVTALAAGALGTVALGIHLAQDHASATTAQGVTQQTSQSQQAPSQREQRQRESDDGWGFGDDGSAGQQRQSTRSGGQGTFQSVVPPANGGNGGSQVRSHGS